MKYKLKSRRQRTFFLTLKKKYIYINQYPLLFVLHNFIVIWYFFVLFPMNSLITLRLYATFEILQIKQRIVIYLFESNKC